MNELKVFNYDTHEVRTVTIGGEPWWVLKDVCDVLGLSNPTIVADRLDDDEKDIFKPKSDLGLVIPNRGATVINESGLYKVIIRSDKPEAKRFQKWITSEVLPTIRKHGAYIQPDKLEEFLMNPDLLIGLARELKNERLMRQEAEERERLNAPKVLFANAVESSENSILIGQLAKLMKQNGFNIGQNRLFELLRQDGYLIRQRGESYNHPSQKSMELGLMEIKKRCIVNPDESTRVTATPKITGKGQIYFINKYCPVTVKA